MTLDKQIEILENNAEFERKEGDLNGCLNFRQLAEWLKELRVYKKSLPPVNLQPKIGHWIWQTEDIYRCSECHEDIHVKEVMNVPQYKCCPMCEAKMESEE